MCECVCACVWVHVCDCVWACVSVFEHVWVCASVCVWCYTFGGQKTPCRNQFFPSTLWVLEMELRSSGLVASTFICCTISLALLLDFLQKRQDSWCRIANSALRFILELNGTESHSQWHRVLRCCSRRKPGACCCLLHPSIPVSLCTFCCNCIQHALKTLRVSLWLRLK